MKSIESKWGRNLIWTRLGKGSPIQSYQMFFQNRGIGGQDPGREIKGRAIKRVREEEGVGGKEENEKKY
jgi:hypothetical protein